METNELIAGYVILEMAAKKQADHMTLLNINIYMIMSHKQ